MKSTSPADPPSVERSSAATLTVEETQNHTSTNADRSTLLAGLDLLAATDSVVATLDLTARLLAEIGITAARMRLDRHGFLTEWRSPQAPASASHATQSVRAGTTGLEVWYCGELNSPAERAVGAILRAAAIQSERCSRRVWRLSGGGTNTEGDERRRGADIAGGRMSGKARKLAADIERVSRFPHGILITGETGTGKTLAARQIHAKSARANKPFVELNCAAIPEHLVEAELFGHRKGAFTGADRDHKGLFEEAEGGVLFLDEVGDIPPAVQNKLLKAIDEKQVKRLGTNQYVRCDVQVIAATSRDLRRMIRDGSFREDLYCRLAVLNVEVAPLRERREDIPALIDHFLREAAGAVAPLSGRPAEYRIESGAVEMMCAHEWVGNIRVLRNTVYELTSYVSEDEPVTMERVRTALAKLSRSRADAGATSGGEGAAGRADADTLVARTVTDALRSMAHEGDVVLPLEVCLLRRGETLKQWEVRAKQCGIEATRVASGGLMRDAAERLGLTRGSLKSQLHRVRHTPQNGRRRAEGVEL